jgi:hypothetical protein
MVWVANQAIRSAVGLPFEIVKVLQQEHSCWTNWQEEADGLSLGSIRAGNARQQLSIQTQLLHRDRHKDTDQM